MSFDPDRLERLLARHGRLRRVLILDTRGSVPRGPGTAMWVWGDGESGGQDGTIGGGRLEWEAAALARAGRTGVHRLALGPGLGQCCGGAVTLHVSDWTDTRALVRHGTTCAYGPNADAEPGDGPLPRIDGDTVIEALQSVGTPVYIWGAGHVGRALAGVLAPLPRIVLHWVDLADKFPDTVPDTVTPIATDTPERIAASVPENSINLILTHAHDTDLALCHALLTRGVARIGLIGSDTKWARFRTRLRNLGHESDEIDTIRCPIGDPSLGKHPQAIAIGVAAALVRDMRQDIP